MPVRGRGDTTVQARGRRRTSRGVVSVEYGLLIAMIGAVVCLGVGVAVKSVFQETISCFLAQVHSTGSASCGKAGTTGDTGDDTGDDTGATPGVTISPSPTPTPSPTTTPPLPPAP